MNLATGFSRAWAALPLRLMLGFGFMYHGFPKLFTMDGHNQFVGLLQQIGVPAANYTAWLVGLVEFAGGLALFLGAFVAFASALLTINMLVAMFTVHLSQGFNFLHIVGKNAEGGPVFGMPGYEVNLLYIAGLCALFLMGAGRFSLDEHLEERVRQERAATRGRERAEAVVGDRLQQV